MSRVTKVVSISVSSKKVLLSCILPLLILRRACVEFLPLLILRRDVRNRFIFTFYRLRTSKKVKATLRTQRKCDVL